MDAKLFGKKPKEPIKYIFEDIINKKSVFYKGGNLIFFGDIFGGRYGENILQIIDFKYDKTQEELCIHFNLGEICTITNPKDIIYTDAFIINDASRIIWEYYYYGKEKTVENLNKCVYDKIDTGTVSKIEYGNLAPANNKVTFDTKEPAFQFC
ncbi:hypothetical protein FACS189485_16910 [Spirochaetia bacterium]|nr:hypothetical protein FACS189485_16910 [Spirochaetia bacterium]